MKTESPPKRIRLGLIGAGSHACRTLLPALEHIPFDLCGVCDLDEERARATARRTGANAYTSFKEMREKETLDAVVLVAGPSAHPILAAEALEAGLHVWMEKPPCFRASEIDPLIAKRGDRVVVVGFKKAFRPATDKILEIVADPARGPVRTIVGTYPIDVPENGREVLEKGIFTNWLGNGCHPLSQMVAIAGNVKTLTVNRSPLGGGFCFLEFESGAVGALHMAWGAPASQAVERYQFVGDGYDVTIENGYRIIFQRGIPFAYGKTTTFAPEGLDHGAIVWEPQNHLATLENRMVFTQGFYGELRYFYDCIAAGKPAERGTLEFAQHLTRLYEASLLSDGKPVNIADLD